MTKKVINLLRPKSIYTSYLKLIGHKCVEVFLTVHGARITNLKDNFKLEITAWLTRHLFFV